MKDTHFIKIKIFKKEELLIIKGGQEKTIVTSVADRGKDISIRPPH